MFNTMTITKTAGALIGALLTLLLVNWAASSLYHVGAPAHAAAEGEDVIAQAYAIDTGADDAGADAPGEEAEPVDMVALVAAADPAAGERTWGKCRACHKLDGTDGTGPHLDGVVGRAVASVAGFAYSDAMVEHAAEAPVWDENALAAFLDDPRGVVPGTKMAFAGLGSPEETAAVIAYLQTTGG
ncbi:c-type cytochrome [Paracoccus sp. S-4012]|uniref:c-type cytochrome n=1 Tax=Paracoccus sp. S-4012 TaxID=2665648 RepID=UPI0012B0BA0A|nr:c-type cytochrome [Paracoccus sp. S-4012]MRX50156.1 c-type cytochrome [Paracoccus sp. S-4012]